MAKPVSMPAKRQRFSAGAITASTAARAQDTGDGSELVATIRRWGSTFGVFDDGSRTEPLWQLQVTHGGRLSFGYQLLGVCREALQEHPNQNIRDLAHLEAEMHMKILHGAPPMTGAPDPDGVGLEAWQPVVYASTPAEGLDMIRFIMQHKVKTGQILQLPHFIAVFPAQPNTETPQVPAPWIVHTEHPLQQHAFRALPPRGRRHVLLQVEVDGVQHGRSTIPPNQEATQQDEEIQENDVVDKNYTIMFFGGIYGFRELFDAANIQGGSVPQPDGTKDEYVRHMKVTSSESDRQRLKTIFEQVLLGVPVYLIDQTDSTDDPLVSWLLTQPAIHLGERSAECT